MFSLVLQPGTGISITRRYRFPVGRRKKGLVQRTAAIKLSVSTCHGIPTPLVNRTINRVSVRSVLKFSTKETSEHAASSREITEFFLDTRRKFRKRTGRNCDDHGYTKLCNDECNAASPLSKTRARALSYFPRILDAERSIPQWRNPGNFQAFVLQNLLF